MFHVNKANNPQYYTSPIAMMSSHISLWLSTCGIAGMQLFHILFYFTHLWWQKQLIVEHRLYCLDVYPTSYPIRRFVCMWEDVNAISFQAELYLTLTPTRQVQIIKSSTNIQVLSKLFLFYLPFTFNTDNKAASRLTGTCMCIRTVTRRGDLVLPVWRQTISTLVAVIREYVCVHCGKQYLYSNTQAGVCLKATCRLV